MRAKIKRFGDPQPLLSAFEWNPGEGFGHKGLEETLNSPRQRFQVHGVWRAHESRRQRYHHQSVRRCLNWYKDQQSRFHFPFFKLRDSVTSLPNFSGTPVISGSSGHLAKSLGSFPCFSALQTMKFPYDLIKVNI